MRLAATEDRCPGRCSLACSACLASRCQRGRRIRKIRTRIGLGLALHHPGRRPRRLHHRLRADPKKEGQALRAEPATSTVHLPPGSDRQPAGDPPLHRRPARERTEESECPIDSQVGVTEVTLGGDPSPAPSSSPIYNMAPPGGDVVARFGFFAGALPDLHQRPRRPDRLQLDRDGRRGALGGGTDRGDDDALGRAGRAEPRRTAA